MTWQPVDCHAHSTMSDGALSVEGVVARASERGVRPSVADHISRDVKYAVKSIDEIERYLDTLDEYDVLRGGEFCWHDALWRELPGDLAARFTHRIGSLHSVHLERLGWVHAFTRRHPPGLEAEEYMRAHLAAAESLTREMPVDILAHPTLVTLAFRRIPAEELWTEEHEERLVEALARSGIAFEISNRYRPHGRLVARAVERGVRIALGSDGHNADQVADIAWPLALARSLGVRDEDLYDPERHGSRAHHSLHAGS